MTKLRSIAASATGALVITALFVISPSTAGACSCAPDFIETDAYENADTVFLGSVENIYPARSGRGDNPEVVVLQVSDVYKGEADQFQGVVTSATGASCGFDFLPDGVYVVFARESGRPAPDDGFYTVGLCGGTKLLSEGELAVDVIPEAPNDAGPPSAEAINNQLGAIRTSLLPEGIILVSVLAVVLGLAGFFSWRDQRDNSPMKADQP